MAFEALVIAATVTGIDIDTLTKGESHRASRLGIFIEEAWSRFLWSR